MCKDKYSKTVIEASGDSSKCNDLESENNMTKKIFTPFII